MGRARLRVIEMDEATGIEAFIRGDDAAYERCVRGGGYVLVERKVGDFMLHESDSTHLQLTPGRWQLTDRPRRWHRQSRVLADWAVAQTGTNPRPCTDCMSSASSRRK